MPALRMEVKSFLVSFFLRDQKDWNGQPGPQGTPKKVYLNLKNNNYNKRDRFLKFDMLDKKQLVEIITTEIRIANKLLRSSQ